MNKIVDYFFLPEKGEKVDMFDCIFFFGGIFTMFLLVIVTFLALFCI